MSEMSKKYYKLEAINAEKFKDKINIIGFCKKNLMNKYCSINFNFLKLYLLESTYKLKNNYFDNNLLIK